MRNVKLSTDHGFSVFQCFSMLHTQKSCWILLGLGRVKPTGFPVCARTFVRINLYAQDHTASSFCRSLLQTCYIVALDTAWPWAIRCYSPYRASYGALAANKNELAARAFERVSVLVSADGARCGGAVFWLRRLRTFLFQPVACQQVVGFCLAIWVYAGVICFREYAARGAACAAPVRPNVRDIFLFSGIDYQDL